MSNNETFDKKEEMNKEELVYVMSLMFNCVEFSTQINKLSKPCLFRMFDDMAARGNNFAILESRIREEEHKNIELQGKVDKLTRDKEAIFNKLRNEVKHNKRSK